MTGQAEACPVEAPLECSPECLVQACVASTSGRPATPKPAILYLFIPAHVGYFGLHTTHPVCRGPLNASPPYVYIGPCISHQHRTLTELTRVPPSRMPSLSPGCTDLSAAPLTQRSAPLCPSQSPLASALSNPHSERLRPHFPPRMPVPSALSTPPRPLSCRHLRQKPLTLSTLSMYTTP